MWKSIKQNFIPERAVTVGLAILDFQILIPLIKQDPTNYLFITFFSARILFVVVAYIFSYIRLNKRFYVPGLREMSQRLYWQYTSFLFLSMKSLIFHQFIKYSPSWLLLIEFSITVGVVGTILMSYQRQNWALPDYQKRQNRIKRIARKAGLSDQELLAIFPNLVEAGKASQRKPMVWSITEILLGLIIAATISSYASQAVNILRESGFELQNLLPPY
jgi:Zn-dependent protease with chaperone function